jgi:hypothetical protein
MRQQIDKDGFPGSVGPDDCRVFVGVDGKGQAVEDTALTLDDSGIVQLENGLRFHKRDLSALDMLVISPPMA